ncbi:MAG TPA: hypothetical protein PKC30_06130 [Saprospiraceae bacterium]|nr:hypothetical protein [Saprospiraceae bacterium]
MLRFLIISLFLPVVVYTQRVTVADEINVRNDYAYDILGQVGKNILLFRDKGINYYINIYDSNLRFIRESELRFPSKRVRIASIIPRDSTFNVIYNFRERDTSYLMVNVYDESCFIKDTVLLEKTEDQNYPRFFRYTISEDMTKTVLFNVSRDGFLHVIVIENRMNRLLWRSKYDLVDVDMDNQFRKIVLSNEGVVFLLFEKENVRGARDRHFANLIGLYQQTVVLQSNIDLTTRVTNDMDMAFNNMTGHIIIVGLSSNKSANEATEYFFVNKTIGAFNEFEKPTEISIGAEFITEIYGKLKKKKQALEDYEIRDIVPRQDGGFILITEMNREFSRRSAFTNAPIIRPTIMDGMRGWTDHYNEDIAVFAVRGNQTEHWRKVLYKKQFSQDDQGIYSSFFVFKTPSRLKIIYNDEIKNNNTVSQYIINPIGKFERNSLLSTFYQNLRLRFTSAKQISNQVLLVPSEKNYNLRLVKIDYTS